MSEARARAADAAAGLPDRAPGGERQAAAGGRAALDRLLAVFAARGLERVEPPVLHPVKTFVDLAGEDFRRRLFTTGEAGGEEMALRPDFTIPVALMHLARAADPAAPASYAYCGPVFRQRRRWGPSEFLQAGVEWIGRPAAAETDAALLALAIEAAAALDLPPLELRIGDADLFAGVVDRLPLPRATTTKLKRAFGDPERLERLVAQLAAPHENGAAGDGTLAGLPEALARLDPDEARRIVRAVVDLSAAAPFGGRSADEIAERLLARAAEAARPAEAREAAAIVQDYLAIRSPAAEAPERLEAFAARHGLALEAETRRLGALVEALAAVGVDTGAAGFEAGFGRRLDYYTGFVFEFHDPAAPEAGRLIGGGRYDRLLSLLGAGRPVPAIGFSVWLDRLGQATPGGAR